jgi:hypothetical protein
MPMKITVASGPHDRRFVPVQATIPDCGDASSAVLSVWNENKKEDDIPASPLTGQISKSSDGQTTLTFVAPWIPRNSSVDYEVEFVNQPVELGASLEQTPTGDVEVTLGGKRLGRYNGSDKWVRPFLEPVAGPFGHSVTRGWPSDGRSDEAEDHPHHKSIWVAHGDVNGVDNWSEEENCGRQIQKEIVECAGGAVVGVLETKNDWVSNSGEVVMKDQRKFTFYAMPSGLSLFDVEVELEASEGPVKLGDTKEGGILAVRVATQMDVPRTGRITNADGGLDEGETWGKRSAWCDYSGLDEGGNLIGIAVMNHPMSNRYPTHWHVRNYGLMTANPYGLHDFLGDSSVDGSQTFEKGEKLWFGYRVFVHAGDAEGGHVDDMFHAYANPPKVVVEA